MKKQTETASVDLEDINVIMYNRSSNMLIKIESVNLSYHFYRFCLKYEFKN